MTNCKCGQPVPAAILFKAGDIVHSSLIDMRGVVAAPALNRALSSAYGTLSSEEVRFIGLTDGESYSQHYSHLKVVT